MKRIDILEDGMFRRIKLKGIVSALRGMPVLPAAILATFLFVGLFGLSIAPHDPTLIALDHSLIPPFWQEGGSLTHPIGTDHLGRDVLSRIIVGAGVSLQVAFFAVSFGAGVGCLLALLAGFLGGWVDNIIMRVVDIFLSLPYLMIALALGAALGGSKTNVIIVLVVVGWAQYARVLRSEVLRIKESDFISRAIVSGAGKFRIMWRHIFPNLVNTLIVLSTLNIGIIIVYEAALSFLGVGIPPPDPSWGSMLADGRNYITTAWWLCTWPGVAILIVVLSCNLLGDWLRIRLDPKFKQL